MEWLYSIHSDAIQVACGGDISGNRQPFAKEKKRFLIQVQFPKHSIPYIPRA